MKACYIKYAVIFCDPFSKYEMKNTFLVGYAEDKWKRL